MKIGLTENEAKFYFVVQKYRNLTINDIKAKTGFSTATTYRIFENLKNKNLIMPYEKYGLCTIQPRSLKALVEKLASEQRKLAKLEFAIKRCNNLMAFAEINSSKDSVEILFDREKLIEHCHAILHKNWNEIFCFGSPEKLVEVLGFQTEANFVNIRVAQGKKAYAIFTEIGQYANEIMPKNIDQLRNIKIKSPNTDHYKQNKMVYIYGNQVTIWHIDQQSGPRALIINEPLLVSFYKENFDREWQNA